jgi:hypothetical protein
MPRGGCRPQADRGGRGSKLVLTEATNSRSRTRAWASSASEAPNDEGGAKPTRCPVPRSHYPHRRPPSIDPIAEEELLVTTAKRIPARAWLGPTGGGTR